LAFTNPGESEGPQVADALGIYLKEVGIEPEMEVVDWARLRDMFRNKNIQCCIWPNIISWRPVEDWIRVAYYSKEPTQNNFSKSTLLLYDPWRESPVFCLGIPRSCSSIQIPPGHRYTSFLKPYFWDRERDGALCRTQRS